MFSNGEKKMDENEYDGLNKSINQEDKVEPVTKALSSMGLIWKKITTKLGEDSICYLCKKELDKKEEFDIIEVPANKIDKGLSAFVSVCKNCNSD
jgi:hypothetical protein